MSTNKQALREAAEKATPGEWKRMMRNSDELMTTFHGIAIGNVFVELTTGERDIFDAEFIAASNPATMLALLDELEAAEARIAELEAREVKLPKPELVGIGEWPMFNQVDVINALSAAGITVKGDSE